MSLADKVPALLAHIQNYKKYLDVNREILDIFNGNLKPYVEQILKQTLSENYFEKIRSRVVPINVLKRITEKTAKTYIDKPERTVAEKYEADIEYYEKYFCMNQKMQKADDYAINFKGYALEPFIHKGEPRLRVIPYDKFLPYSDDPVDPTVVTVFIKFMGKVKIGDHIEKELFYAYSDTEFYAFLDDGQTYAPAFAENGGINPYGVIPFFYGNRGNDELIPTQDSDTLTLTKMVPVILTDLAGAIMFQCFTIMYGIDVSAENLTMSPNAFWSLKSDKTSDKQPELGTLKPEADIEKVINYVMTIFSFWLETRGIKVGNIGQITGSNFASGISKIIDEMDTTELVMKSMEQFKKDEDYGFWPMMKAINNNWVATNQLTTKERPMLWGDDFEVSVAFDEPEPVMSREQLVTVTKLEEDSGYLDHESAMKRLHPDLTPEQIDDMMAKIDLGRVITVPDTNAQPQPPATEEPTTNY